jgi:hypothetical protein
MGQAAQTTATAVDLSTRFLVELENLWTLLRLYGTEHPAFKRGAATASSTLAQPFRVSVSPKGFTLGKATIEEPAMLTFSQRLRAMGLVGLAVQPGMTAADVTTLVLALDEVDRGHMAGAAVVEKLAAASGRRVMAIPLKLSGLRLMEGTADDAEAPAEQATVWRDLFAGAFSPAGGGDKSDAAELAGSFELALKAVASPAQWDAMVGVWVRQLATATANEAAAGGSAAGAAGTTGPAGTLAGSAGGASIRPAQPGTQAAVKNDTLDSAAAFLSALSPHLSRRLLAETFDRQAAPQSVLMALADRLPKGVVLGALATVDTKNRQPSMAALALLRKMAQSLGGAGSAQVNATPRTTAEMVEIAASLERLLGSEQEAGFVPESYLNQRQELSQHRLSAAAGLMVAYPGDRDTARHAAGLAFQILTGEATPAADLTSALAYVRNKTAEWIKAGEFAVAAEGLTTAKTLCTHWDRTVAKPATELVAYAVTVDDLVEGSRQCGDRAAAAEGVATILARLDGAAIARALATLKPSAAGGHEAVLDAMRKTLPCLGEDAVRDLCKSFQDATPPALLSVLSTLGAADAVKVVSSIAPHAASSMRRAIVHSIFRHDLRWPLPIIEQFLKDDDAEIRRLAVMKVVTNADLPTAARIFREACNRRGPFEADVALGLAELLHHHRRHPDVRAAFRQWTWSGRRWVALFSLSLADRRRAA